MQLSIKDESPFISLELGLHVNSDHLLRSSLGKRLGASQGSSHTNKLWHILQALAPLLLLQLVLQDRKHRCLDVLLNKIANICSLAHTCPGK